MTGAVPVVGLPPATGNGLITTSAGVIGLDRDLRDSTGDRWYWHIQLSGEGPLRVRLASPGLVGGFGPALSRGGGTRFEWLADQYAIREEFDLDLRAGEVVRLAATLPYGPPDLTAFVAKNPQIRETRLAWSESGRRIPVLHLPALRQPRSRVVLAARHHACEAAGSLLLEGAVNGLNDLRRQGLEWAADTEVLAFPMVDLDGVVRGDQGKGRLPHDHNRDYGSRSRYAAVRAIRAAALTDALPTAVLDLHTPGLIGPLEERPFLVASGDPGDAQVVGSFAALIGSGPDADTEVMVFNEEWNSIAGTGLRCFAAWARSHPQVVLATSVEYPNAVVRGVPVSYDAARRYGERLAAALGQVFD